MKNKMEEKKKIEILEISTKRYFHDCPVCNHKISSNSLDALKYNYRMHLDKHLRNNMINKENMEKYLKNLENRILSSE